ncbi:hypothetical protein LWS69_02230 [Bordetella hinzii]|nr:hypothetical protein [Bordetella hinzii]
MNAITEPVALIDAPCTIDGQDIEAYHRGPGISKTGLDHVARSPALFYALHLDPARQAESVRRLPDVAEALAAFVAGGLSEECAKLAVTLIAKGEIPAIKIIY